MALVLGVLGIVVILQALVVAGLLRSQADIVRAVDALADAADVGPARAPAADAVHGIVGIDTLGGAVALSLVGGYGGVLLAFLSSTCLACRGLWTDLAHPSGLSDGVEIVAITHEPPREDAGALAGLASRTLTTVLSSTAWDAFDVPAAPYFVLVDAQTGRVLGEGAAGSWSHVLTLVERWSGTAAFEHRAGRRHLARSTSERLEDVDAALRAAGIGPGHRSLRPE